MVPITCRNLNDGVLKEDDAALTQPLFLYVDPLQGRRPIVVKLLSGDDIQLEGYPPITILPSDTPLSSAIYLHLSRGVKVKVGIEGGVDFVLENKDGDKTINGNPTSNPLKFQNTIKHVFEIVDHWVDDTNNGASVKSTEKRTYKIARDENFNSPLIIDGELPHSIRIYQSDLSNKFSLSLSWLRRLNLPSTWSAAIAVSMYTACYVHYNTNWERRTMVQAFIFLRDMLLRGKVVLDPTENGVLLPPPSFFNPRVNGKGDHFEYCKYMLSAMPAWTQTIPPSTSEDTNQTPSTKNDPIPLKWDQASCREILGHLATLVDRKVDDPLPSSALPYACAQFEPLEARMHGLSVSTKTTSSASESVALQLSCNRLDQMGVKRDVRQRFGRTCPTTSISSFGSALNDVLDEKNIQKLWERRCAWSRANHMIERPWIKDDVLNVYMAPFGCGSMPMMEMANPVFAQYPVSLNILQRKHIMALKTNGVGEGVVLRLTNEGNALFIYESRTEIYTTGATANSDDLDERVRAFVYNVERLVQLTLLYRTKKSDTPTVESFGDSTNRVDFTHQRMVAAAILGQLLKTDRPLNFTSNTTLEESTIFENSMFGGPITAPLGEVALAFINSSDFSDALWNQTHPYRAVSPPIPIPVPNVDRL